MQEEQNTDMLENDLKEVVNEMRINYAQTNAELKAAIENNVATLKQAIAQTNAAVQNLANAVNQIQ